MTDDPEDPYRDTVSIRFPKRQSSEITLEERVLRMEAHLGIGDSPEAEKTREKAKKRDEESRRWSARMQYLMNPYLPNAADRLKASLET